MAVKLKSCPFCGGKAKQESDMCWDASRYLYYVECADCGASTDVWYQSEEEAVEAWNRRTDDERDN